MICAKNKAMKTEKQPSIMPYLRRRIVSRAAADGENRREFHLGIEGAINNPGCGKRLVDKAALRPAYLPFVVGTVA
jgi:hypothetical protein